MEVLDAMRDAIKNNQANNKNKSKLIRLSWWCLIFGFVSLIVFSVFYMASNISLQDQGPDVNDNSTLAAGLIYDIFPDVDNATLSSVFPGIGKDDPTPTIHGTP